MTYGHNQILFSVATVTVILLSQIMIGYPTVVIAQPVQVGVSLKLYGVTIPNNSLVDFDDVLYRTDYYLGSNGVYPTNARPELHDQALLCVTDLEDCCESPSTVHGDWHYPNGNVVRNPTLHYGYRVFMTNRGQNEVRDGRQFYGSVRLWRRYSPPERGRFYCKLPNAANSTVNQTLYVNLVDFGPVIIYSSGSNIVGEEFLLTCTATLNSKQYSQPSSDIPSTPYEWFFGPNNASLPSGVTPMAINNGDTYSSTLQFSPLSGSHAGNYTCRLGAGRLLVNSTMVTVNAPTIDINITASGAPMLGQNRFNLSCRVQGLPKNFNASITYIWTKNNNTWTQIQVGTDPNLLSLSPLKLSDAGQYTCQAAVSSPYLYNNITAIGSHNIICLIPTPSLTITNNVTNPICQIGSAFTLTCTVELSPAVDILVIVNTVWIGPAGFMMTNTAQPVMGSTNTYISTATVSSLGRNQAGNYTCKVTIGVMSSFIAESVGCASSTITVVPEATVSLHSDSPNPVLSGSSLTLTCTAELSTYTEVNIPKSVTTTWKGPDGTIIASSAAIEMKSITLYTSSHTLNFLQSADSGEYTCTHTMNFGCEMDVSASINITIVDAIFQLRLKSVDICHRRYRKDSESEQYSKFIKGSLTKAIERHCKCHIPLTNFLNEDTFICEDSPNSMIYRNALLGTHNFNRTQIIKFIEEWVSTGPLIKISRFQNSVRVDSNCSVAISSMDEPVCVQHEKKCLYDNDPEYAKCAENLKNNSYIASCFEGCVFRNGN